MADGSSALSWRTASQCTPSRVASPRGFFPPFGVTRARDEGATRIQRAVRARRARRSGWQASVGRSAIRGQVAPPKAGVGVPGLHSHPWQSPEGAATTAGGTSSVGAAAPGSPHEYHGWLFKTASSEGPLERLREARRHDVHGKATNAARTSERGAQEGAGVLAALTPPTPRFVRWCVLDVTRGILSIYSAAEEYARGAPPKGLIATLQSMAVVRQHGVDGGATLALLPRGALAPRAMAGAPATGESVAVGAVVSSSWHQGVAAPILSSQHGSSDAADGADVEPPIKSWYLRASDDAMTAEWFHRLAEAGVHCVDELCDGSGIPRGGVSFACSVCLPRVPVPEPAG